MSAADGFSGSPAELEAVLRVVEDAAEEAAAIVLRGFRQGVVAEYKGAVDLVTQYDRESEARLKERLGEALGFPVVGEEAGGTATKAGPVFYVDPLDGTTNFVHGHPFWCVSIGLTVAGEPVLGVVRSPPLGLEWLGWVAASGERFAVRRSLAAPASPPLPCAVSRTSSLDRAMLATGFPYDRRTTPDNNFAEFTHIKLQCQAIRRCGSAAIDLCFVADGTYDGYWEQKLSPWDVAAGIALVRASGGRVTDYDGGAQVIGPLGGRLVASNGSLHDVLLAELRAVRPSRAT